MDTKRLQELAGIILNEVSETDMKKLRRIVILAIFSSDIPAQLKKDLNAGASGAPDSGVRKVTKVFLDQVLKDEETLNASPEYQELKQDPEFQKLSQTIVSILNRDNKAGLLDMSNIAFTTSNISKPFSYSVLLYHAVETEASKLLSYLQTKYKDDFRKVLSKMLPSQSRPAVRPTRENLDELSNEEEFNFSKDLDDTVERLDSQIGTNLAFKNYVFPTGYPEDRVKKIIRSENSKDKLEAFYYIISVNTKLKDISGIKNITDINNINDILAFVVKHVPPEDIKFYVEEFIPKEKSDKAQAYEKSFSAMRLRFTVGIGWLPGGSNTMKIIDAINRKNDMIK